MFIKSGEGPLYYINMLHSCSKFSKLPSWWPDPSSLNQPVSFKPSSSISHSSPGFLDMAMQPALPPASVGTRGNPHSRPHSHPFKAASHHCFVIICHPGMVGLQQEPTWMFDMRERRWGFYLGCCLTACWAYQEQINLVSCVLWVLCSLPFI